MAPRDPLPPGVVVIDPAFLGDVVFDGPLVGSVKAASPETRVGLVVRPPGDAIARAMVGVDRVHVFDKRGADRGLGGLTRVARELAAERYGLALIPHPSPRSALLARLAQIPVRRGLAPSMLARPFLTEVVARGPRDTFVSERLKLLSPDVADAKPEARALSGTLRTRALSDTQRTCLSRPATEPLRIGLALGSQWPTKRWDSAQACAFVRGLADRSDVRGASMGGRYALVLLGAADERPLYDALRAEAHEAMVGVEDAVGGSVDALLEAIARCDLVVAGDTGPLQIARALGIPVVALFGPTGEARHDFGPRDVVLAVELSCRPCSAHGGLVCPEGHHRCMKELAGGRVLEAVRRATERRTS